MWGQEECIQGFVVEPERKRPLGRYRHRLEDSIKIDLQEVRWVRHGLDRSVSG